MSSNWVYMATPYVYFLCILTGQIKKILNKSKSYLRASNQLGWLPLSSGLCLSLHHQTKGADVGTAVPRHCVDSGDQNSGPQACAAQSWQTISQHRHSYLTQRVTAPGFSSTKMDPSSVLCSASPHTPLPQSQFLPYTDQLLGLLLTKEQYLGNNSIEFHM